jgi:hypothetical protein
MVKRPTGSDGEPSSPNCGASAGVRLVNLIFCQQLTVPDITSDRIIQISSADMKTGRFASHGEIKIRTEGDILHYDAIGPFNIEALQALAAARTQIVTQWRRGRLVAAVVHWHNSALMSPEAFADFEGGLKKFYESTNTPVALAWISAPEVEGMSLMIAKFVDLFARHNVNFRLFEEKEAALAWVNACLARSRTGSAD